VLTSYVQAGDGSYTQETAPDGTIYKEFFVTSGWGKGLTTQTEVWSGGAKKKYSTIAWTQDDTSLPYQKNARPTETNVFDAEGNRSRTTIEYNSGYSLPTHVREWGGANGDVLLRLTATAYKGDAAYINNRVIGLPYERVVYDGPTGNVMAREIYQYDWGSPYFTAQAPSTNYADPGYIMGRGNLIGVVRFNCTNNTTAYDDNQAVWVQKNSYNMAGSVVWSEDAGAPRPSDGVVVAHRTNISYADSFSDNNNARNTLAYPTQLTDPDGFSSTTQFNYDFGATTRTQDPKGSVTTVQYDPVGRPDRVTGVATGAYTRYVYQGDMGFVQSFSTVRDTSNEVRSEQHYDGVGRLRASSIQFPGSTGGYRAVHYMYDSMGRRALASNPTEVNSLWVPSGDDAAGWVWTTQAYDWKGRPTVTTKPDTYTTELSYSGCGCAGGEVVTSRDERGRRVRLSKDVHGRPVKVEELNWDQSVYSTTIYAYNTRDQITSVRHYQGTGGSYQERLYAYDGFGRLASKTTPEQGTTTYVYNGDDTLNTMTDARGTTASYKYNSRHLVTNINYVPSGGAATTPNVLFGYDEVGNRTSMNDGQGSVAYNYDTSSRLKWEERTFSGLGPLRINYDYDVSGQLTSVTNPWGSQVSFARDAAGQVTNVGGVGPVSNPTYAQGLSYRAHGGVKQATYGNGRQLNVSYDGRLRVKQWGVSGVVGWDYNYDNFGEHTGRVTLAQNLFDAALGGRDARLDRAYDYDQVGRLTYSTSGSNARSIAGLGDTPTNDGPYSQDYDYDTWGNLTTRAGWGGEASSYTASFNSKNQRVGFTYDASGNLTFDGGQHFTYDATGQQTYVDWTNMQQGYDGDALRVKKNENGVITYYLRSAALGGQVLAEMNSAGSWVRGYVYSEGGGLMAIQADGVVRWVHQDPVTKTQRVTDTAGATVGRIELDPWGGVAGGGWTLNPQHQPRKFTSYERDSNGTDEAMMRRYNRWHSRFDQPDPYEGSYDITNPQSFNRYAYAGNDPVNFVDPTGLDECVDDALGQCTVLSGPPGPVGGSPGIIVLNPPAGRTPYGPGGTGGGGGGGQTGGGTGGTGTPQNPQQPTPDQRKCDDKLAGIFGDKNAVAAGSGFEPAGMPGRENAFRGGPGGHLNNAMHLYGSGNGFGESGVYVPSGGQFIGKNPYSSEDSYMFYYKELGSAKNVTLFTSHVDNFSAPRGVTSGRTRIGDIGGDGGRSPYNPNNAYSRTPYVHSHMAIHQGRGFTGKRLSFFDVFCK
jgi:RHS repeat-associated protein